jgi:hypothetical protein
VGDGDERLGAEAEPCGMGSSLLPFSHLFLSIYFDSSVSQPIVALTLPSSSPLSLFLCMPPFQTDDNFYALVFATSPCIVTLSSSSSSISTTAVNAGVTRLSLPLTVGGGMTVKMTRDGVDVVDFTPQGYQFVANPPIVRLASISPTPLCLPPTIEIRMLMLLITLTSQYNFNYQYYASS